MFLRNRLPSNGDGFELKATGMKRFVVVSFNPNKMKQLSTIILLLVSYNKNSAVDNSSRIAARHSATKQYSPTAVASARFTFMYRVWREFIVCGCHSILCSGSLPGVWLFTLPQSTVMGKDYFLDQFIIILNLGKHVHISRKRHNECKNNKKN